MPLPIINFQPPPPLNFPLPKYIVTLDYMPWQYYCSSCHQLVSSNENIKYQLPSSHILTNRQTWLKYKKKKSTIAYIIFPNFVSIHCPIYIGHIIKKVHMSILILLWRMAFDFNSRMGCSWRVVWNCRY